MTELGPVGQAEPIRTERLVLRTPEARDRAPLDAPRGEAGFTEAERFEAWGAKQRFGMQPPATRPVEFVPDSAGNGGPGAAR
jgi:hypothetical protein